MKNTIWNFNTLISKTNSNLPSTYGFEIHYTPLLAEKYHLKVVIPLFLTLSSILPGNYSVKFILRHLHLLWKVTRNAILTSTRISWDIDLSLVETKSQNLLTSEIIYPLPPIRVFGFLNKPSMLANIVLVPYTDDSTGKDKEETFPQSSKSQCSIRKPSRQ